MALVVDAQATASDSVAAHNNPIISSLDPISARAQLRTAAPADIAAAAASWLPSSTDLLAGSSDPRAAYNPASMELALGSCSQGTHRRKTRSMGA